MSTLSREDVYKLIDGEREYQSKLGPDRTDGSDKTVGDYLTMLRSYLRKAENAWTDNAGCEPALDQIRKVAAIAVRCMEDHGAPERPLDSL